MIDTHAHLTFPPLYQEVEKVIAESKTAGLTGIILGSSNLQDSSQTLNLAQKHPGFLFASVGIHPQKTDPQNKASVEDQLQALEGLILKAKASSPNPLVALGETGLDFSPAPPGNEDRPKEEQMRLFQGQIKLAQKHHLPLIIHAREAIDEVIKLLSNFGNIRGTFHCYAGGRKRIAKILTLPKAWYFGFDGNLTYDEGLQNTLKLIPQERILIETDSPFLAPIPHRGEVNTPAYLPLIQEKINEILGQDLTQKILENSQRLFNFHC